MNPESRENLADGRDSAERPVRRPSRRVFLRRMSLLGAVALAAVVGEAACGQLRQPDRRPTAQAPAPGPTAKPVAGGTNPVASADPTPAGVAPATPKAPARQPNVLLVTIDTLRSDRIGPYGYTKAHTPNLDQLAREGVRFDRAICQLPQTNASHAALMTGLYASTSGVKVHMVDRLPAGSQTIATVFAEAGYQTAGIYSWVSLDPQFCGLDQGFQTYEGYVLNRSLVFSNPGLEQIAHAYRQLKDNVPIVSAADAAIGSSSDIEETLDGRADVTYGAVVKWLDAHVGSDPFFLWVHFYDPHYPYAPPQGYDHILGLDYHGTIDGSVQTIHEIQKQQLKPNPADLARMEELYQGEIAYTDSYLGKLLGRLKSQGIADDTIVAVTGDHGESFGEHGDWQHGLKVYETEIRVPLLMRYPRRLPAGAVIPAPAQLIDIMPTLFDLAGLHAGQSIQGTSLLPVITGQTNGADRAAFTELADDSFVSVLTWGDWKLIRNDANGELQLYNLNDDESEENNLLKAEPKTVNELNARLLDLMKVSGVTK